MKYTQDNNCQRGVDSRLLGQMLGSCEPINADYKRGSCNRARGRNARQSAPLYEEMGSCCEGNSGNCTSMTHIDDARLGSACAGSPSLAMAYSPFQHFHRLYSTDEALERGTLFCELDKPWRV